MPPATATSKPKENPFSLLFQETKENVESKKKLSFDSPVTAAATSIDKNGSTCLLVLKPNQVATSPHKNCSTIPNQNLITANLRRSDRKPVEEESDCGLTLHTIPWP
jgi:hypothetical protein